MKILNVIPPAGVQQFFERITQFLGYDFIPGTILSVLIPIGFIALYALIAVYVERKVSAFIQDRVGPIEVGPYGLLQTIADIVKLLTKEDIVPKNADKILFTAGPIVIFSAVFAGWAALPFSPAFLGSAVTVGVFYIMAIVSIDVVGILMAGWGQNNKYALYGAIRAVAQIISYEIPAGLAILTAVVASGSLNLQEISYQQGILAKEPIYLFGIKALGDVRHIGGIVTWNILQSPILILAYVIYFIASLAECNRAPFDIPEGESELVAGFHVEYGGFKFAVVFLAEYAMMFIVGTIAAVIFLGGWNTILPNIGPVKLADWTTGPIWGAFWILSKALFAIFVHIWIRWTLPRLRADQLMNLCWKVLTPAAFFCLIVATLWKMLSL